MLLTGKTKADFRASVWSGEQRVVFATPEVVRNDLLEKRLPNLNGFALLVFDECHRAVKDVRLYRGGRQLPEELSLPAHSGHDGVSGV